MLRNATHRSAPRVASSVLSLKTLSLESHHLPHSSTSQPSPADRRFASTRHSSRVEVEALQLPRFLRRQHLQPKSIANGASSKSAGKQKADAISPSTTAFRSRHYDASKETAPKSEIRLLEPHALSARLKKLCDAGKLPDAIYMLKNAPLDAQNTQVWNTLIWECLKEKRHSTAYQLFVDMKRRGFSPTLRTFQTFFNGLSRIESWSTHTKQLAHARSLYEGFQRHVASIKRHDPSNPELSSDPLAGYIRLLGNAGQYQEIFDVYYALDLEGPMTPTQYVYTAMFQAIAAAKNDTPEGAVKAAADARLLWAQMLKASKKNPSLVPDSHTIVAALNALSGGNGMDYHLAFKIVSEYYGLDANKMTSQPGLLTLQPESLAAILRLCNQSKQYSLASQFYQQVRRRPENIGGASIIDRGHMEEVFKADIALREPGIGYHAVQMLEWMLRQEISSANGPKIRPALSTYTLVMQGCRYSGDWSSATRTFDLMTGYHSHDFMDGSVAANPRLDKRGPGRSFSPTADVMSWMLGTAQATKNRAHMRQALRIVDHLGFDTVMHARGEVKQETNKVMKSRTFFGAKFASVLMETTDHVMEENGRYAKPEEARKWWALYKQAQNWSKNQESGPQAPKPRKRRSVQNQV
ncbi:hypothetical protein NLJ89_g10147 [Agrocybe chaxingu]|uniref:Uncharacterized protein n=1 Tax=Agrocybe chaxingu TaxID=84603 RepID=A0A9W8MSE6_9AGAR|nr:hypothetical protein NLJ89_g10147 [Agrocybe chaxingu]